MAGKRKVHTAAFNADSHGRKPPHISQAIASTFSQNLKISGGPV
jgi:hypothetical protein